MESRSRQRGYAGAAVAGTCGTLPEAVPVAVGGEAELRGELERVAAQLAPAVEWTQRVEALLRLEGLVLGGAARLAAFPDALGTVRDALAGALQERRSAVSRQACHALGVLAAACGPAFEPLAMHLLPVLFKTLAMGIQVVSEAADACAHAMLAACPSPRLLPKLCATVAGDRNGRLRQAAADYLLRALETWQPTDHERQQEGVERALLAAARDAQGVTRATGRRMFGAYARVCPAQARALLAHLEREGDRQLGEKLAAAAREHGSAAPLESLAPSQPLIRRASFGSGGGGGTPPGLPRTSSLPAGAGPVRMLPAVPKLALPALGGGPEGGRGSPGARPASARSAPAPGAPLHGPAWQQGAATARENQPDNRAAAPVQATPRSIFPKTRSRREAAGDAEAEAGRERLAARRSLGGAALRMSLASFARQQELGEASEEPPCQPGGALAPAPQQRASAVQRMPLRPPLQLQGAAEPPQQLVDPACRPLTARRGGALDWQASGLPEDAELCSQWEEGGGGGGPPAPASLAPLLAGLGTAGVGWAERVAAYQSVQAAMEQAGGATVAADVASNADRLVATLLEGAGDAHFRVAAAALAALGAGLAGPACRLFEAQLDRVLTALFARCVDPKEHIRGLVAACLSAALRQQGGDAVVAALARALQANRGPRVKCAVMHFFAAAARGEGGGDGDGEAPPPLLHQLGGSAALAGLLRGLLQLATDKNPDIRRAAAEALAAAYQGGAAQAVLAVLHSLPPADQLAAQRAVGPAIQQQAAAGGVAQPQAQPRPRPGGRPAAAGAGSSGGGGRRQSSEGLPQSQPQANSSGSPRAESGQGSQVGSPAASRQQAAAAAPPQSTPQPPSPFVWRALSSSPPAAASPASPTATASDCPAPAAVAHGPQQQAAAADLPPLDDAAAAQLGPLLALLRAGPSCEALQGLSQLAPGLPAAAWPPCFEDLMVSVCGALGGAGDPALQAAAAGLTRGLAAAAQPSLFLPALPTLLPALLGCAAEQQAREVALAADEALAALLARAPPLSCLAVLAARLPAGSEQPTMDRREGAQLLAAIRALRRVAARMPPAALGAQLQPLLLPGLCAAFCSPLTDVRKAAVDCLVAVWQVVGGALQPHLQPLSASQLRLLEIYRDRAAHPVA